MWRHAVLEAVQVAGQWANVDAFLAGLSVQSEVPVLALRAGCHLEAFPEQIETLGDGGIGVGPEMVEGANAGGKVRQENELVPEAVGNSC